MNNFFKTKIRHFAKLENGKEKFITETFIFEAVNYTEAETAATQHALDSCYNDFSIIDVTSLKVHDVVKECEMCCPLWFKVMVEFTTLNERTGKEQHFVCNVLMAASCFNDANHVAGKYIAKCVTDARILGIVQTNIEDVILSCNR